jgi:CDP-diacylglycerol--glycerol-3-phosphate 3-phosphatidyltransferase
MKWNLPNKITLVRIFMIPIFVAVFFLGALGAWRFLIAAVVFALAAATDALDGHIARSRGLVTNLGKFLDPIADKVLVSTAMMLLLAAKCEIFGVFAGLTDAIYVAVAICICVIILRCRTKSQTHISLGSLLL